MTIGHYEPPRPIRRFHVYIGRYYKSTFFKLEEALVSKDTWDKQFPGFVKILMDSGLEVF